MFICTINLRDPSVSRSLILSCIMTSHSLSVTSVSAILLSTRQIKPTAASVPRRKTNSTRGKRFKQPSAQYRETTTYKSVKCLHESAKMRLPVLKCHQLQGALVRSPLRSRSTTPPLLAPLPLHRFFARPLNAPLALTQFSARSAPFSAPIPLRSHALTPTHTYHTGPPPISKPGIYTLPLE